MLKYDRPAFGVVRIWSDEDGEIMDAQRRSIPGRDHENPSERGMNTQEVCVGANDTRG